MCSIDFDLATALQTFFSMTVAIIEKGLPDSSDIVADNINLQELKYAAKAFEHLKGYNRSFDHVCPALVKNGIFRALDYLCEYPFAGVRGK